MAHLITYTASKLYLSKDEREIAKSWGAIWNQIAIAERRKTPFYITIGRWSGYNSKQERIVHVDVMLDGMRRHQDGTIKYSDNTFLYVSSVAIDRMGILNQRLFRKPVYNDLIKKLIKEGNGSYYEVK